MDPQTQQMQRRPGPLCLGLRPRTDRRVAQQPCDRGQGVTRVLVDRVVRHHGHSSLSRAGRHTHPAIPAGPGAGLGWRLWITRRRVGGWARIDLEAPKGGSGRWRPPVAIIEAVALVASPKEGEGDGTFTGDVAGAGPVTGPGREHGVDVHGWCPAPAVAGPDTLLRRPGPGGRAVRGRPGAADGPAAGPCPGLERGGGRGAGAGDRAAVPEGPRPASGRALRARR